MEVNQTISDTFRFEILSAVSWIILAVGLPTTLLAIYGLYFFIKADNIAPVYVINLLISDVVQICANPFSFRREKTFAEAMYTLYYFGLIASVWFMVCIAAERFVMIAYPVFYRYTRTMKTALLVSFSVWMMAAFAVVIFTVFDETADYRAEVFLPSFPLLIGFFLGTWKVLLKSRSVSSQRQQQIMGTLALMLFIYVLLFLPFVVSSLLYYLWKLKNQTSVFYFHLVSEALVSLNPMLDPVLYVFMRRDAENIVLALPCVRLLQKSREPSEMTHDTFATNAVETQA